MKHQVPSNAEKLSILQAWREGNPIRVPLLWVATSRIVVLNDDLNPEHITYEQTVHEPLAAMTVQSRHEEYLGTVLARTHDQPVGLPDE